MRAGDLDQRVALQSPAYNSRGDEVASWTDVATVWAAFSPVVYRADNASDRIAAIGMYTIRMRYSDLITVMPGWRAVHRNVNYEITGVRNLGMQNDELQLDCRRID